MASRKEPPYQVEATGPANEEVGDPITKASSRGELQELTGALQAIVRRLETRPLHWGDPERRTRKQGGLVYHGIEEPLIVQYVVFKTEKVVCLLHVWALPGSSLAE